MDDRPSNNIIANHDCESTGANGILTGADYDINCPALGMPDYKLNYLAESCETRLKSKVKRSACSFSDGCPRFRPTVATVKPPVKKVKKRKSKAEKGKHTCVCCGKIGVHHRRGLIDSCSKRNQRRGTLTMFPLNYSPYVFEEAKT